MNFSFGFERTLPNNSLEDVRYAVGFVSSLEKLIRFHPTVIQVWCVSSFLGPISATTCVYVTVHPAGNFYFGINKMLLLPCFIHVPTPWDTRPISFAN